MKAILIGACFVFVMSMTANALANESGVGVKAGAIHVDEAAVDELKGQIVDLINAQLRAQGVPTEGHEKVFLLIDARESGDIVAVSITRLVRLPDAVIELGAQAEAFYPDAETLPASDDGRKVRQHMTRSWLEQYHDILGQEMFIVSRGELQSGIESAIATYGERGFARF